MRATTGSCPEQQGKEPACIASRNHAFQTILMFARAVPAEHRPMDTMSTLPYPGHTSQHTDEHASWDIRDTGARRGWHRLTHDAVVMAWTRDPEVMCDLVATLMDIHLRQCSRSAERTLDELHLMISLELQQLSGEPD